MTKLPQNGSQETCTGCSACAAVCPEHCITMQPNNEGFLSPIIDISICTDCGICRDTCPVNSQRISAENGASIGRGSGPLAVYAGWYLDEHIRQESSSGGVFTAIAESILAQGGVVVGAAFDDQLVVRHILIESSEDLHFLRGSKYVQSEVSPVLYYQIRSYLKKDRPALFSGTPCQIAGLRSFLRQPYENLFCCDLICHGVPSPLLFERYVRSNSSRKTPLATIDFRDKTTGWKTFGVRKHYQNGASTFASMWADPYMAAFLRNYSLRPACYACNFKGIHRFGDLTIADFWGVEKKYPEYDTDDKGTSLLLVNNEKGMAWLNTCRSDLFLGSVDLDTATTDPMLVSSCSRPPQRDTFYTDLDRLTFETLIRKYNLQPPSMFHRVLSGIKRRIAAVMRSATGTLGVSKRNRV